eukprot:scaffold64213_cov21-Tisochrysis_lutea.AAC.1
MSELPCAVHAHSFVKVPVWACAGKPDGCQCVLLSPALHKYGDKIHKCGKYGKKIHKCQAMEHTLQSMCQRLGKKREGERGLQDSVDLRALSSTKAQRARLFWWGAA